MRLAWYSPLPPQRSGIADYSAELLPALAREAPDLEIELLADEGVRPDPELAARFPVHAARSLPELLAGGRFDLVLYHLGNNRDFHAAIYRALLAHPGVVVLHEAVLHHLVRDLTLYSGDPDAYARELAYAYGRTGEALARRALATGVPLDPWSAPLFERVVDRSLGVIVHNDYVRRRVLGSRPLARLAVVPHHLSLGEGPPPPRDAARAALALPASAFVVASFGFFTAAKRPEVLLRAFARLRREHPEAMLVLAGEISPHYDFARALTPERRPGVIVTGRLELPDFLRWMAAADVAVNLRHPTAGETSGTLIRLLGMGKPVVVSRAGAFAEIPDGAAAKVDVDDREEDLLLAYLRRLIEDAPLRRAMGENARAYAAAHHGLAGSARGYAAFLREVAAAAPAPFDARPPLLPFPDDDLLSALVRETTTELVDLGAGEADDDLLFAVAEAIAELGL
jgi:glycosyltransferase involved in cell wall biosynthesis